MASQLTSGFGRRRIVNNQPRSPHSGVDLKATTGTPIKAANAGKVVLAEDLYFSGNTVVLDHGFGLYTFYAHCSTMSVNPGDTVTRGQVIAEVGATGRVTGPHLHWACRVNEARVNPLELTKAWMAEGPPATSKFRAVKGLRPSEEADSSLGLSVGLPQFCRGRVKLGPLRNMGLILRVKWRLAVRLLRDNLFDAFVLAPIILYGAFLAVGPQVQHLLAGLASHPFWSFLGPHQIVLVSVAAKIASVVAETS